jgi:hypothetical protein
MEVRIALVEREEGQLRDVIGNEALGKSYGLSAMLLTVLIDRNGRIAGAHSGVINRQATERNIRKLLQEPVKTTGD